MGIKDKWLHPGKGIVDVKSNKTKMPIYNMPLSYTVDDVQKWVIKDFGKKKVRIINGPNAKLNEGKYRIAMRVNTVQFNGKSITKDFHFMKQHKDGSWSDKQGSKKPRLLGKINPSSYGWDNGYNSKTLYLAVKK